MLALCKAKKNGQTELMREIWDKNWRGRTPFPEPPAPTHTLKDFLAAVSDERSTFPQRVIPDQTLTLDFDGPYEWPDGDAATVARRYATDVIEGGVVAGDLMRRAAQRFISDLETGHERGIFFDPIAARHIVQFAERFCGLTLMSWQVWVLANIFGFKKPSGARRYVEAWISCSKKNGKTRLASCIGLFGLVADLEKYPDVFCAATKKEQSKLVWRDARRCVQDNQELREHVQRWAGALAVRETDGSLTPLSSDEKSMDGLRPSMILSDEVSFWGDRDQWDKLTKGVVNRIQPLVFAVTTAGSTKHCFAFGKFALAEKILRGIFQDDSTFAAIFAIDKDDDPMDEKCWPKANPSLGFEAVLRIEHLRKIRDEVIQAPSGLNAWLQYHCNIWPDVSLARVGSIPTAKWDACAGLELIGAKEPKEACLKFLSMNQDIRCFTGLDVGLTSDMSAFVALWPRARFSEQDKIGSDSKKVIIAQFFMPEVGVIEKEKSWGVPLSQWAREGFIELLPGDMVDPREIKKYILEFASRFRIREMGFDVWGAKVMCAELTESNAVQCIEVPQIPKELTAPCRELLAAVQRGELVHFGNPCLAWHAGNVILAEDEKHGGTKPMKLSANEKIDGISATVNAWHRFLAAPKSYAYLDHGIRFID